MKTKDEIIKDLIEVGIKEDDTLIVHSSLKSFGWVNGGAQAVVEALMEVVNQGTIIMPAQSSDNSDPIYWENPPMPQELHEEIKRTMPAYSKSLSAVRGMGKIVETFLRLEGVIRSSHPQVSFCGIGKDAYEILKEHPLDYGLYKGTPVEKMYHKDVKILLMGVGYDSCTLMHYAEYENKIRPTINQGSAVLENGKCVWKEFKELELDSEIFNEIGNAMKKENRVLIGTSNMKVLNAKETIDFAIQYLK